MHGKLRIWAAISAGVLVLGIGFALRPNVSKAIIPIPFIPIVVTSTPTSTVPSPAPAPAPASVSPSSHVSAPAVSSGASNQALVALLKQLIALLVARVQQLEMQLAAVNAVSPVASSMPGSSPLSAPENFVANLSGSSVNLSWSPVPGAKSYGIYQGNGRIAVVSSTSFTTPSLTSGAIYPFSVVAYNDKGSVSPASAVQDVPVGTVNVAAVGGGGGGGGGGSAGSVTPVSSPVPPVISNIAVSGITQTSVTITWTTDQPSTSQVLYGTTTSYGQTSAINATLATSHSVTLTGLTAGTTYHFAVQSGF